MKKQLAVLSILFLLVVGLGMGGLAKTNYFDDLYIGGDVTVVGTVTFAGIDIVGDLGLTGNAAFDGATMLFDGSTSVRNVSAGFTSLESPANRFGLNATEYMQIATTITTGITAITHTGSAPAVTWTADSLSFVGNFDSNGTTAALDGSTSVRLLSAGFVSSEAPDIRFGFSNAIYTKLAVADTTGNLTITHVGGSTDPVTWTAAGGFSLVGDVAVTGSLSSTVPTSYDALLGSVEVDVNDVATTALYTVPTGSSCIITRIVIRSANKNLDQGTDATSNIGFDTATDLVTSADISMVLTGTSTWDLLTLVTPGVMGTTTQVLNWHNTVGCTTADSTLQVDVFGYLF